MDRQLPVEETPELMNKAEAVHIAALNLANTLGVFHGINDALEDGEVGGPEVQAINVIQSDLLHLLVIRVCALCEAAQNRADDASIAVLVSAVADQKVRAGLIAADERWRAGIGPRAERCASVGLSIGTLKGRWTAVTSHPEILKRLYHLTSDWATSQWQTNWVKNHSFGSCGLPRGWFSAPPAKSVWYFIGRTSTISNLHQGQRW
jgi:hypothetical protein